MNIGILYEVGLWSLWNSDPNKRMKIYRYTIHEDEEEPIELRLYG